MQSRPTLDLIVQLHVGLVTGSHVIHALHCIQNPCNIELMWDQMFRSTLNYGRKGLPM